jgi:[ribosomal protein S18]-alanine N-acetyltransferase
MSTREFQLRRATVDDLDQIMHLETSIFVNDAWSRESMRRELGSRHCYYLAGSTEDDPATIVGYAGLLAPRGSKDADIQTIGVSPAMRRMGLGRALVLALLAEATERRAQDVFLEVRADNPGAQTLYRDLGFEQIGVRPRYYQPDDVDALVMRFGVMHADHPTQTRLGGHR